MFIKVESKPFIVYQLIPHKNLKNYNNEKLVRGYSDFSKRIINRLEIKDKKIIINGIDFINFKMYLSNSDISFFISCPEDKKEYIKGKIESSWDKITVIELDKYPFNNIDYNNIVISEMRYKRNNIFSLRTDKDITFPSLITSCMCTKAFFVNPSGKTKGPFGMQGHGYVPPLNETIKAGESRTIKVVFDPNAIKNAIES